MLAQIIEVILVLFVVIGIFVIYKNRKKLPKTETFKTRIEKGNDVFKK